MAGMREVVSIERTTTDRGRQYKEMQRGTGRVAK